MSQERIILDPAELSEGRTELEVTPWIDAAGVDWGEAVQSPYRAEGERGRQVVDSKYENRNIAAGLVLKSMGGTSFATIRSALQAKLALYQREGGIVKRVTSQGGTVYADVVASGLHLTGDWMQAVREVDVEAGFTLECIPDFYEPEEEIASAEEKTLPELIKVIPDPGGDMPARVRIVVEEKQGADQKGLIWAFRSRYYSSASTAKPAYEAEELELLGSSTKAAQTGASGGTVVQNAALPSVFTPVLGIKPGGTAFPTHEGTYQVFTRMRSVSGTAVSAQLVWDVGDLVNPTTNSAWRFPAGSAFFNANLGQVRLQAPPLVGTYRWQGRIDACGTEGGESIQIDRLEFVNVDEGMGVLSAPPQPTVGTLKAWDNFNATTAGTLTGKVASLGGTWNGSGDAVGFTVDTTNHWITRSEKSDADINTGYYARLGTGTATAIEITADISPQENANQFQAVFARFANAENWVMAGYEAAGFGHRVALKKRVAGVVTVLADERVGGVGGSEWKTLRMVLDSKGNVSLFEGFQGGVIAPLLSVSDSALASGGSLEGGGYGIYDVRSGTGEVIRRYDNVFVTVPATVEDAVTFASQKAQLTTQGLFRLDSGGTAYGPVSRVIGDLPRLPAGGRSAELFIRPSVGDFDQSPDGTISDVAVKIFASRSWLTVPGAI